MTSTAAATRQRRAIGIVRVSQTSGRHGESFASPAEQRARIEHACERDELRLLEIVDELDVSGGTPLERRHGLRQAVEAVEHGDADVIVAAYFDRLVRSVRVQAELVERVEAAGGQVLAVDVGRVTNGSAGQWLSAGMLGLVAEYQRRSTAERTGEAQVRAVARGAWPAPQVPTGYLRGEHGRLEPDSATREHVAHAFTLRAGGATVGAVREHLAAHGIDVSYATAGRMLASRAYLGEIHFGDLANLEAHDPIVEPDTWKAVQRVKVPAGRRAKSERLLARLGVLRCASCGGRMSASTGHHGSFPIYRCGAHAGDPCPARVTVSAELVEQLVVDAVKARTANVEGRASVEQHAHDAEQQLERAQADLDAAIRAFAGLEGETAARERLAELRQARDDAQARVDQLGGHTAAVVLNAAADWDRLSLEARRAIVRAVVARVTVAPGRGAGRVTVELVSGC